MKSPSQIWIGVVVALVAAAGACADGDDGPVPTPPPQPVLAVEYVLPAAPDPFQGIDSWRVVLSSGGTVLLDEQFGAGETPRLEDVLPRQNVVIALEACAGGCASGTVVSRGRTLPFEITGEEQTVSMWFARARTFNVPNGSFTPRARAVAASFADGRVLVAGGAIADSPVQDASLYDPATDTISTVATMPSPHAGAAGVMLSSTAFLIAGGFGLGGTASAYAEVWLHDPATGTGQWRSVTPLTQSRAEMGFAGMGGGLAVLVGGSHAGGIRDSIEVFTWDGGVGSWADAEPFTNQVMGSMVIPLDGAALIAGGYRRNVTNGNLMFRDNVDHLSFNGTSWTIAVVGTLFRTRAWGTIVPAGPNRWLLAGGLSDTMANPGPPGILLRSLDVIEWNGAAVTSVVGDQLPVVARRGGIGTLPGGSHLLLGGDTSRYGEYASPIDRALVFATGQISFAPFDASPGPTMTGFAAPLPDGTTVIVTDGGLYRWNN